MESYKHFPLETLETWIFFLVEDQNPCPLFIAKDEKHSRVKSGDLR